MAVELIATIPKIHTGEPLTGKFALEIKSKIDDLIRDYDPKVINELNKARSTAIETLMDRGFTYDVEGNIATRTDKVKKGWGGIDYHLKKGNGVHLCIPGLTIATMGMYKGQNQRNVYMIDLNIKGARTHIELYNDQYNMLKKLVDNVGSTVELKTQSAIDVLSHLITIVGKEFIQKGEGYAIGIPARLKEDTLNPAGIPRYIHRLGRMIQNPDHPDFKK